MIKHSYYWRFNILWTEQILKIVKYRWKWNNAIKLIKHIHFHFPDNTLLCPFMNYFLKSVNNPTIWYTKLNYFQMINSLINWKLSHILHLDIEESTSNISILYEPIKRLLNTKTRRHEWKCVQRKMYPVGPTLIKCIRDKTASNLKLVNKKHVKWVLFWDMKGKYLNSIKLKTTKYIRKDIS